MSNEDIPQSYLIREKNQDDGRKKDRFCWLHPSRMRRWFRISWALDILKFRRGTFSRFWGGEKINVFFLLIFPCLGAKQFAPPALNLISRNLCSSYFSFFCDLALFHVFVFFRSVWKLGRAWKFKLGEKENSETRLLLNSHLFIPKKEMKAASRSKFSKLLVSEREGKKFPVSCLDWASKLLLFPPALHSESKFQKHTKQSRRKPRTLNSDQASFREIAGS